MKMELSAAQLAEGLGNDNILERERAGIKLNKALSDPGERQSRASHLPGTVAPPTVPRGHMHSAAIYKALFPSTRACAVSAQRKWTALRRLLPVCAARADDECLWAELEEAAVSFAASKRWTRRLGGVTLATASVLTLLARWQLTSWLSTCKHRQAQAVCYAAFAGLHSSTRSRNSVEAV